MQTQTNATTPADPNAERDHIIAMLRKFARQRPGLEFGNYGDWKAYRAEMRSITRDLQHAQTLLRRVELSSMPADTLRAAFRAYSGRLTLSKDESGRQVLSYCTGQYWPTEYRRAVCAVAASALWDWWRDHAMPAAHAFEVECLDEQWRRVPATSRKFQTREAAEAYARTVASARNATVSDLYRMPGGKGTGRAGDYLRAYARREFGRGIASRWFN
jgi:hypothetical protein